MTSAVHSTGNETGCLFTTFGRIGKEPRRRRTLLHLTTNHDLLTVHTGHILVRTRQCSSGKIRLLNRLTLAGLTLAHSAHEALTILALHWSTQRNTHEVAHLVNSWRVGHLLVVSTSRRREVQSRTVVVDTTHPLLFVSGVSQAHCHIRTRQARTNLTRAKILLDRVRNALFCEHVQHSSGTSQCISAHKLTGVVTPRFGVASAVQHPLTNLVVLSRRHTTHELGETRDIIKAQRAACFFGLPFVSQAVQSQFRGRHFLDVAWLTVCIRSDVTVKNVQNRRSRLLHSATAPPPGIIRRDRQTRTSCTNRTIQTDHVPELFVQNLVALTRCIGRLEQRLVARHMLFHDALDSAQRIGNR